jgi:Cu-processing system permease protein
VIALVAARELWSALRTRWFLVAAASFLVLSLALSMLGLAGTQRAGLAGFDRTTASLLNLCLLFVPLLTLSLGGLSIAGEIEDGSLALLLAQPITRSEAYLGKFSGLVGAIWAAIASGFGATGVIVGVYAGGGNVRAYLLLVALMLLYGAATLALGFFLSVALRGRVRVVGAAFATWLGLVYLSDLGTIGLAVARSLAPGQVLALALLNPVEQARILGTLALTSRFEVLGPSGIFALETFGSIGAAAVVVGALLATATLALTAGVLLFKKAVAT